MVSDNAADKKIRLAEVAAALNVAPKLIRNWTASQDFDLIGNPDRKAQKWREYSYLDVAHLAIAAQAIRYGFTVGEGHDFAGATLVRVMGPLMATGSRMANMPGGAIEAICRGKHLYLFKLSDGETAALIKPLDDLPRYHGAVHIDLEMCVAMAFAGLAEIGHDAFSSSRPKEYTEAQADDLERQYEDYLAANPDFAEFEKRAQEESSHRRETDGNHSAGASRPGQNEEK
ncbi:hypothetical protein ACFFIQ_17500 [Sphingobium indicum]